VNRTRDTIYSQTLSEPAAFAFDDEVVGVFPDMIKRSVPGYTTIIAMTGLLAGRHAMPDSKLYDLGCSLGASTLAMRQHTRAENCAIVGVDNSESMIKRCRSVIDTDSHETPVTLYCMDVRDCDIEDASMVVLNFTLQFIEPKERAPLIQRIYDGLRPGGILVLSEKVIFEDPHLNQLNIDLHHEFKKANGYSDLEVAQKRSALENVLVPESLDAHRQRMRQAGFESCDVWFQCFNFASLVALK
jgi:tRNA (cmo5U34)-methyltransferase